MSLLLTFADNPSQPHQVLIGTPDFSSWYGRSFSLAAFAGRELAAIGFRFQSANAISNYSINIGNLKVHEGGGLGTGDFELKDNSVQLIYPSENEKQVILDVNWPTNSPLNYKIFALDGKLNSSDSLNSNVVRHNINSSNLSQGIYLITVADTNGHSITKKMVVK
jgi:hypothetical protein